ncbi:hypothetical protein [Rhodovulum steppense]|uniref:Uncharacterized protein n=1 Tax=Rhodovulum steppense TaxID=540251 RepID=A0A4V2R536_9RHOB|nr:hypothetical protein [Rhodovulum steppense]TCM87114.1 hypothetical protein EV216_103192 [Rhodovulum steppense]
MTLKVDIQQKGHELVGKGTIDGIVPFYFKDQGHRWMVRIGRHWTLKEQETPNAPGPSIASSRSKMYWAIAQYRNQSRDRAVGVA